MEISRIVSVARKLHEEVLPNRSPCLDVLCVLNKDDLTILSKGTCPTDKRIEAIANELGKTHLEVANVLDTVVRFDLKDYSEYFRRCETRYTSSGLSKAQAAVLLQGQFTGTAEWFVLHEMIYRLASVKQEFPLLFIPIEEDHLNQICQGYLVSIGRGFHTSIDLLACAYKEAWPNWQTLFEYY